MKRGIQMERYNRRYGRGYRRSRMGISMLLFIIVLAVATGYAGTKYVIYPYLLNGQEPEKTITEEQKPADTGTNAITSLPGVVVDKQDVKTLDDDTKDGKTTETTADQSNVTKPVIKEVKTTAGTSSSGAYSLQFGSFTAKDGAATRVKELNEKGVNAYVFESNGSFRVLGNTYDSKEKAKEAARIVSSAAIEVFVVDMKTIIS